MVYTPALISIIIYGVSVIVCFLILDSNKEDFKEVMEDTGFLNFFSIDFIVVLFSLIPLINTIFIVRILLDNLHGVWIRIKWCGRNFKRYLKR